MPERIELSVSSTLGSTATARGAEDEDPAGEATLGWRFDLAALAAYTALTLAATYPLAARFGTAVPGDGFDSWFHYWNLWWVHRALTVLHVHPYFSPEVYHPDGASLLFHSLILAPALLALPVTATFGLTVAYNLVVVASFVGSAFGAYLLFLDVVAPDGGHAGTRRLAGFFCGALFAFSAYRLTHMLGHLDLLSTPSLPFYALFLGRAWRRPGARNVLLASTCLAITSLCAWYYWLYLLFFTAFFFLYHAVAERKRAALGTSLGRVATVVAASLVWISPLLVPMLRAGRTAGALPNASEETLATSADLASFVVPSFLHPWWGATLEPVWRRILADGNRTEAIVFLGFVPLGLALLVARGPARRFWTSVLVLFCLLSLGPVLHFAGTTIAIGGRPLELPYHYLLETWFPFSRVLRAPSRFVVMATLALALLAGMGALRMLRGVRRPYVGCAALLALALLENAVVPYPSSTVSYSALYDRLREDPGRGALLEVPVFDDPAGHPRRMLYQTVHQKPVYGGYLSRGLPTFPLLRIPGLAPWKTLPAEPAEALSVDVLTGAVAQDVGRATLAFYDTGYVVIDKTVLTSEMLDRARRLAALVFAGDDPYYEDTDVLAYRVPAPAALRRPVLTVGSGWDALETAPRGLPPEAPARWRWMSDSARFAIVAPHPARCRFRFRAWSVARSRRVAVMLDETPLAEIVIGPRLGEFRIENLTLTAGSHEISLRSLDGPEQVDGRPLSIAVYEADLTLAEAAIE